MRALNLVPEERRFAATMNMIARLFSSFAFLHALNTATNLIYTLAQLIVLARLLEPGRYAEIVVLISVSVYLQPFDQAFGRASYIVLRRDRVGGETASPRHEISAIFATYTLLLVLLCLVCPLLLKPASLQIYAEDVLILISVLFMNTWAYNLQSTAWAVDYERAFSVMSFLRRLVHFAALAVLWWTGSLLAFGIIAAAAVAAFQLFAIVRISQHSDLLPLRPALRQLTKVNLGQHFQQVLTSLLSALSELIVLNFPYLLLTAQYGAGPIIVVFDSMMKVARFAMAGARALAEINLSKVTRLLITRQGAAARHRALLVVGLCLGAALVPAAAVAIDGRFIFDLLLGHNNVVPSSIFLSISIVILATAAYQPIILFLSYGDSQDKIRIFTLLCSFGAVGLTAATAYVGASIEKIVLIYTVYCCACVTLGLSLMLRMFKAD